MDHKDGHMVYLLLGSNLGDRMQHLENGMNKVKSMGGNIIRRSSVYETAPWGVTGQPDYLNAACKIVTRLSPQELFSVLKKIERNEGRTNQRKYASRTLDIDILFYDDLIANSEDVIIPHPKLHLRKFVLVPMQELDGSFIHPVFNKSINDLLKACDDPLQVRNFV